MPSRTTRPGIVACRDAPGPALGPEAEGSRPPAQLERHAVPVGEPIEDEEVEVDHVPAGEHVRVELAHAGAEGRQQVLLGREGPRPVRTPAARRRQQEHLRDAAAVQADREQAAGRGIGLDVEGENGEPRRPVGGEDLGILEHEAEPGHVAPLAADLEGAADAPVDQVPRGEADVGLVGRDAGPGQAVAQRGSVRGLLDLDAHDGPPEQGDLVGGDLPERPLLPRARRVVLLDVEAGDAPAVAHEERAPVLEPPEEVEDGDARLDTVRRLQDEPAASRALPPPAGRPRGSPRSWPAAPRRALRLEMVSLGNAPGREHPMVSIHRQQPHALDLTHEIGNGACPARLRLEDDVRHVHAPSLPKAPFLAGRYAGARPARARLRRAWPPS